MCVKKKKQGGTQLKTMASPYPGAISGKWFCSGGRATWTPPLPMPDC